MEASEKAQATDISEMGLVSGHAVLENSWYVIAYYRNEEVEGTHPHGVIAFDQGERIPNDRRFGTAEFFVNRDGDPAGRVVFYGGHYDLTRNRAIADFARRVEKQLDAAHLR